jgi:hypothetical protein
MTTVAAPAPAVVVPDAWNVTPEVLEIVVGSPAPVAATAFSKVVAIGMI